MPDKNNLFEIIKRDGSAPDSVIHLKYTTDAPVQTHQMVKAKMNEIAHLLQPISGPYTQEQIDYHNGKYLESLVEQFNHTELDKSVDAMLAVSIALDDSLDLVSRINAATFCIWFQEDTGSRLGYYATTPSQDDLDSPEKYGKVSNGGIWKPQTEGYIETHLDDVIDTIQK